MSQPTSTQGAPVMPEVKMHLHSPADPAEGVVVETRRCTAGRKSAGFVRHISINVTGTRLVNAFIPGQSFGVIPPGVDARGIGHKLRLYSLSCQTGGEDGNGAVVSTTVKRLIDEHDQTAKLFTGVSSNYLCDLAPGDTVKLTGPAGKRFLLPADHNAHDYVFIATGTGIAPFRGMTLDLLRPRSGNPASAKAAVLMGSPYSTDLLYDDLFRDLAGSSRNFRYLTSISREGRGQYVQDRLADVVDLLTSDRTVVYICGLAGMELGVFQSLARLLPEDALRQYLEVDPDVRAEPARWERRMIHKQVRPTRRVLMEVY